MYHRATQTVEDSRAPIEPPVEADAEPTEPAREARKERVLHTRVPAVLERELKRFADNLRVPVSTSFAPSWRTR